MASYGVFGVPRGRPRSDFLVPIFSCMYVGYVAYRATYCAFHDLYGSGASNVTVRGKEGGRRTGEFIPGKYGQDGRRPNERRPVRFGNSLETGGLDIGTLLLTN